MPCDHHVLKRVPCRIPVSVLARDADPGFARRPEGAIAVSVGIPSIISATLVGRDGMLESDH